MTREQPAPVATHKRRWRAVFLAVLIGLLVGGLHLVEPIELALQVARAKLTERRASGLIVLVAIDDRSVAELGRPPWQGTRLAELVDHVRQAGARTIHLDAELPSGGDELESLRSALARAHGKVSLPARFSADPATGQATTYLPAAPLASEAKLVNTNLRVGWDGSVRTYPYSATVGGQDLPSLAAFLADTEGAAGEFFPLNYSISAASVPVVSASDVLAGREPSGSLAGRKVVIARTDLAFERFWVPGFWMMPAAMLHIMAAETLSAGHPVNLGFLPPLIVSALLAGAILVSRRRTVALAAIAAAGAGALILPFLLDQSQIYVAVLPGLITAFVATCLRWIASARRRFVARGTTNLVTGLPNLQALRQIGAPAGVILVAARIKNYPQIIASLQPQHERDMVEQIVARLSFGTESSAVYQLDEGVFVWLADHRGEDEVVQQIEALHALFRSPIVVATRLIDLAISFGIDMDDSRTLMQRVPSAMIAADGASREGKRWASFNPASLEDAEWEMSLLARLDHAMETDELWIAYQPKLDLLRDKVVGAEALVRWTHPEKGQIFPDQFIGAAEAGGRIESLTYFVLDRALEAAALINAGGERFEIAVNLSALLLSNGDLVDRVEALVRKHRLPPELLTLEVTETSTMGTAEQTLLNMQRLADAGFCLSIDDYGTGFSTLGYLKRIPANEIKIDRSFISMLHKSQSDRIMVNSTIQLAHSLGRKVVAEGVENEEVLAELRRMECDVGQGYHIARPCPLPQLLAILAERGDTRKVA